MTHDTDIDALTKDAMLELAEKLQPTAHATPAESRAYTQLLEAIRRAYGLDVDSVVAVDMPTFIMPDVVESDDSGAPVQPRNHVEQERDNDTEDVPAQ